METVEGKEVSPGIILYENAINNEDCDEIIKKAQEDFDWESAKILKLGQTYEDVNNRLTDSISLPPIFQNDIFWFSLSQCLWSYGDKYAKKYKINFSSIEWPYLLRYKVKEGFFLNHVDTGVGMPRIFSALIYLNNVDSGGETYFDKVGITIKPKKGTLALFPADYIHSHEATVPTSNEKFVIATWFNP